MYLHKLLGLSVENLALRPLRSAFLVLTVAIGAGATMFLVSFYLGLNVAIRQNLLKGMPDKQLTVQASNMAESVISSQLTSMVTLGKGGGPPRGISDEHIQAFQDLHKNGVTKGPVRIETRPMLPFMVSVHIDFDRMKGLLSLVGASISERDRRNAGGKMMFHGVDSVEAWEQVKPFNPQLEEGEVPVFIAREWLGGAKNISQLQERPGARREKVMLQMARIGDLLFFPKNPEKSGARGVPVLIRLNKDGALKVVRGRIVGFCDEATMHGLTIDSAIVEEWNDWNNSSRGKRKEAPLQLAYNKVILHTQSSDDMLSAAEAVSKLEGLKVSGRLVTARRLTNLRDLLPPATAIIGAILFFLAAGGIVVGLSLSVAEQTKRIGILRAVGARRTDILFLFLCEALIVGLLGVALGYALQGVAIEQVDGLLKQTIPGLTEIDSLFRPTPNVNAGVGLLGVLIALLAGLIPAFTATLIRPSEVLKV